MDVLDDDPPMIARSLADRVRARRLELNLTQQGLARRAGLVTSTYRRFESSAEITLGNLILVAVALGATDDFAALFRRPAYTSIDDVLASASPTRRRGRRNA